MSRRAGLAEWMPKSRRTTTCGRGTVRCQDRWVDPLADKTATPLGPYSCGRPQGHRGAHATDGHGASALWDTGGLLLSIQVVGEREERGDGAPDSGTLAGAESGEQ